MALIDGLISYYKLDGNSNDAHGSNNGSDSNITYGTDYGKIGQGAKGTGINIGSISFSSMPAISGEHTLAFWFKADAKEGSPLSARTASQEWRSGIQISSTDITPLAGTGSTWLNTAGIAYTYSTGAWYYLVAVYTSTGVTVYINGTSIGSKTWSSNTPAFTPASGQFALFYSPRFTGEYFNGSIDEVGIWSRALSSTEVGELYNSGAGLTYPFITGSSNFFQLF